MNNNALQLSNLKVEKFNNRIFIHLCVELSNKVIISSFICVNITK